MLEAIKQIIISLSCSIVFVLHVGCATQEVAEKPVQGSERHDKHAHHDGMDHSKHMMHGPVPASKRKMYAGKQHGVTQISEKGNYRVTLYSSKSPIPQRTIHDWVLHLETQDGELVEDAKIYVFGGMPMHQHGFPTRPRIKEYLGAGNYRIEGIKFNMPGHWEMRFNIKRKDQLDRVVYKIHLGR